MEKFKDGDQLILAVTLTTVNFPVMGFGYYDANGEVVCFYLNKNLEIVEHSFPEDLLMKAMDFHFHPSYKVGEI